MAKEILKSLQEIQIKGSEIKFYNDLHEKISVEYAEIEIEIISLVRELEIKLKKYDNEK